MKFKTFRTILIGGALVGGLGLAALGFTTCAKSPPPKKDEPVATAPTVATATPPVVTATAPASESPPGAAGADHLRAMDREILARLGGPIAGDRVKEAFPGRPYKVSLYKDDGHAKINRVKVDLDRDGKWDEKWTIEDDGTIKRQIAPADDEAYTVEMRLRGDHWEPKVKH